MVVTGTLTHFQNKTDLQTSSSSTVTYEKPLRKPISQDRLSLSCQSQLPYKDQPREGAGVCLSLMDTGN